MFQRDPNLVRFEKTYYFSRILRQIGYILVIKNFTFTIVIFVIILRDTVIRTLSIINWQISEKKRTTLGG